MEAMSASPSKAVRQGAPDCTSTVNPREPNTMAQAPLGTIRHLAERVRAQDHGEELVDLISDTRINVGQVHDSS